jgi:hypothetical protein
MLQKDENIIFNRCDQVKEDEMGRECNKNWGEDECINDLSEKARRTKT